MLGYTMRYSELIQEVSRQTGEAESRTLDLMEAFFRELRHALSRDKTIEIKNFGRFICEKKNGRVTAEFIPDTRLSRNLTII